MAVQSRPQPREKTLSDVSKAAFEVEVTGRFGILPNFFQSAKAAPELIQELWGFAKAGYLDNPMPSLFKERLFVWLSRFCPVRYCIVRHVGFLLGRGHASGDPAAPAQTLAEVLRLLRRPTPWQRNMSPVYARLAALPEPLAEWPEAGSELEDLIFACATVAFVEPGRSDMARSALSKALGPRRYEFLAGCLAFIRTAHYWTVLHPEIETEEDMRLLLRNHAELSRLLLEDPEAGRCDVSEPLFAELTALRELNERKELENAKRALEEKDRQKDQFIAVLAHELRNPLSAIRAATDALGLMNLDDPKIERFRVLLDRQSAAMARMLDDLLDASRIAFGKVSVQMVEVDLREIVRNTVEESTQRIKEAGLTLDCEFPKTSCRVLGDRIRLRQVLDNLLSNSIKFTSAPGRIAVRLRAEPGSIVLRIEDTGRGFDATWAERLFQPFVQEEQDLSHSGGGLGLGLAISSRLAALHGGELSARSPGPGEGATFTLTLPLAAAAAPAVDVAEVARPGERSRILLVEDNTEVADTLAEMLGLAGFRVEVTYDGPSALARATATAPEIIVCDLGLPAGMDGYAVARACRADPALRDTRLIAASGYSRPEDHAKAKAAGFDVLVGKPVGLKRLEEVLREILPKR